MLTRPVVVIILCLGLLVTGLGASPSGEVIPETVARRLDGLPAAAGAAESTTGTALEHSAPVRTPIAFSMVGFRVPHGAEVEFRTSTDGVDWSTWTPAEGMELDEGPDPETAEAADAAAHERHSEPVWVGEARWLQTRVSGAATAEVAADLVDSMGLSRSLPQQAADAFRAAWRSTPAPAAAESPEPHVMTRAQWGADESLRKSSPSYASDVRMGVVHHTAGSNSYSPAESPGVVRAIYHYHTQTLGWSDIGYNLLVDRFGTVYEGRYGGREAAVIGAHARGWNTGSFGVSVMGCFDSGCPNGGSSLPSAAEESLVRVLAWKFDVHHIDVLGRTDMPEGNRPTLVGHRDVGKSACPGDRFYPKLGDIRQQVAALQLAQGGVIIVPDVSASSASVEEGVVEPALTFSSRLREQGPWQLEVTDHDGRVVHRASGSGEVAASRWSGGQDVRAGAYTYEFSGPGRRSAAGSFRLTGCEDAYCDILGSVHREAILRLHDRGVVSGCAPRRYCPSNRLTRAEMATFMSQGLGLQAERDDHFVDVPPDHPHAEGINALYEHGTVQGYGEDFRPDIVVRRDQMATFIAVGLDWEASGRTHFSDVAGNVHERAINALADRKVTEGDGSGRYLPAWPIRRDQATSLLDRALGTAH